MAKLYKEYIIFFQKERRVHVQTMLAFLKRLAHVQQTSKLHRLLSLEIHKITMESLKIFVGRFNRAS